MTGVRIALLTADDEADLLEFELANRAFFARSVGDRGDDYFAEFPARQRALIAENEAGTSMFHLVRDSAGRLVGRVNLVDIRDGSAEIGYRIADGANGRGYAGEAVRLALAAAAARGVRRVTAMVTVSNLASRRVLERNDFQLSARDEPAWVEVNDSREPVVHFEVALASGPGTPSGGSAQPADALHTP